MKINKKVVRYDVKDWDTKLEDIIIFLLYGAPLLLGIWNFINNASWVKSIFDIVMGIICLSAVIIYSIFVVSFIRHYKKYNRKQGLKLQEIKYELKRNVVGVKGEIIYITMEDIGTERKHFLVQGIIKYIDNFGERKMIIEHLPESVFLKIKLYKNNIDFPVYYLKNYDCSALQSLPQSITEDNKITKNFKGEIQCKIYDDNHGMRIVDDFELINVQRGIKYI